MLNLSCCECSLNLLLEAKHILVWFQGSSGGTEQNAEEYHEIAVGTKVQAIWSEDGEWYVNKEYLFKLFVKILLSIILPFFMFD